MNSETLKRQAQWGRTPGVSKLSYGGNLVTSRIRDFLYKDSTVFLGRKYDLASNISKSRLTITPELLLEKMFEFGEQKKIAKNLGYSETHIARNIKKFEITNQIRTAKQNHIRTYYGR